MSSDDTGQMARSQEVLANRLVFAILFGFLSVCGILTAAFTSTATTVMFAVLAVGGALIVRQTPKVASTEPALTTDGGRTEE